MPNRLEVSFSKQQKATNVALTKKRKGERERREIKKKKKRQVLFQQSSRLSNFLSKLSSTTVC